MGLATAFGALALICAPAQAQQAIAAGQSARGALAQNDARLDSGEFADIFTLNARAGESFTIEMSSTAFDTYLLVRGPGGLSQDNDDSGDAGTTNSRVTITAVQNGAITIRPTSYAPGLTGAYVLNVRRATAAELQRGAQQQQAASALQVGQTARGTLANGDERLAAGEFVDTYTLSGQRGQTLVVELTSTEFDAYVMVRGPGGLSQDNDDSGERGSTNSRVSVTLPESGQITIRPTSYRGGETGAYALTVREQGQQQAAAQPVAAAGAIGVNQRVNGALAQGDSQLTSGEFRDVYSFRGRRGQQLEVRLNSAEFDPYVFIRGPEEFSAFNDDDAENNTRNSRMLVTLPADGEYSIVATSYQTGERGSYALSVAETNDVAVGQGTASTGDQLRLGREQRGQLATGDTALRSGEFTDTYRFRGEAGQRIRIDMASRAFDSYVILVAPSGAQEDNDDGPGGVGNSMLETVLAESGEYAVIATSYQPGESGAYTLRVSASTEAANAPTPSRPGGRVFAVMVGISDYQGTANNLQYTDEDAVKMGEALRRAGVLADQSVVLTNAQATVAGVRAAFQRVATQAGPNDTFLFFYSGHGTQTAAAAGANEPDQRDESIVMVDGLISDDQMAQMFRQVRAGTSIIALDSCFSGGFARDVVAQPGVMGLFSSEEDLTSAVAEKFQAGGYLSLFLRNGLAGEADANRNGALTAGELSVYLRQQFASNAQDVESSTMEGQRNYQFLVVDRGGVRVDDLILNVRG